MAARFTVTYGIVTPESAEAGDYAESGFLCPLGYPVAALIGKETPGVHMRLSEAVALATPDSCAGRWLYESDGRQNFQTGATETRAIHPPGNITPASYARLKRALGVER